MGNIMFGIKVMFRVWSDSQFADQVRKLMPGTDQSQIQKTEEETPAVQKPAAAPSRKGRSEALTLLALLQREGRMIDFLKESLDGYSDAQIGASVRGVHKDCSAALERLFGIEPLRNETEGAPLQIPPKADPSLYRIVGNSGPSAPAKGILAHPGWKATRIALPEWTGSEDASMVIAPCEIEVK